ncbi:MULTISPECIES: hypothetical protein [unclassified Cryobacterium]|nr:MULTISPECIES: hypothetical protein [Cryobacterium]MEB0203624.1 hypothetical protein [Cryobacterium sp. 5I3]MDY7557837.1 hypothetical protein [Cryobacterium sp. 10C3]MEB0003779.1 hypothetical protein [Cryobacterium sp. RTC2.1]MEB0304482.1 hypothetical protein [Cryobacterium sp. 10I1]MEC5151279.1 hypothetical protein [Cryobacterium psychrotolerans]
MLLLAGCVPGQSIDSLAKQPEAALTYPGSIDVRTNKVPGRVQFGLDGGDVDTTGISGTTTHSPREVLAFYSRELVANGWKQVDEEPYGTTESGRPAPARQWEKTGLQLGYFVAATTEGEATKYETILESLR